MKILSIGIPTFNRANDLNQLLSNLYNSHLNEEVQILVSNNGSTDSTNEILVYWLGLFGENLTVLTQVENLGFDLNVVALYESAKSSYIWFMSDEDVPTHNLSRVVEYLKENFLGIFVASPSGSIQIAKENVLIDLCPYSPTGLKIDHVLNNRVAIKDEEHRVSLALLASQISTCILPTGLDLREAPNYLGGLPQTYIAHLAMRQTPFSYVSNYPLVELASKTDVSGWFLDSCFTGTKIVYEQESMLLSKQISTKIISANYRFGIKILIYLHLRQEEILCKFTPRALRQNLPPEFKAKLIWYIFKCLYSSRLLSSVLRQLIILKRIIRRAPGYIYRRIKFQTNSS